MTALRPITLSAAQVRQLPGTLTIERKISPQPGPEYTTFSGMTKTDTGRGVDFWGYWPHPKEFYGAHIVNCPWGAPGQKFWVREAWDRLETGFLVPDIKTFYRADNNAPEWYRLLWWKPARTMPREYSRFTLELVTVAVTQRGGVWYWRGEFASVA